MDYLNLLIYEGVIITSNFVFLCGLLRAKPVNQLWKYLFGVVIAIVPLVILVFLGHKNDHPIPCIAIEIVLTMLWIDHRNMLKKFLWYLVAANGVYIVQIGVISVVGMFIRRPSSTIFDHPLQTNLSVLAAMMLVFLLYFITMHFRKKEVIVFKIEEISPWYLILFVVGCAGLNMLYSYIIDKYGALTATNANTTQKMKLFETVALLGISLFAIIFLAVILFVFFIDSKRKMEKIKSEMEKQYIGFQKSQYEDMMESQKRILKMNHDIKHHIGCLQAFSQMKEYEKIGNYLTELTEEMSANQNLYIKTGNEVLDAVLNYYDHYASVRNIVFQVDSAMLSKFPISDIELSALLGNAISNAMEATLNLDKTDVKLSKEVLVKIDRYQDFLAFKISNHFEDQEIELSLKGKTKKTEDVQYHGIGIQSMRDIVEKYNGTFTYSQNENWLELLILIKLPD